MNAARYGTCVCGHAHEAHEHYRAGTDCSRCAWGTCLRFRGSAGLLSLLTRLLAAAATAPRTPAVAPTPTPSSRPRLHVADSHDSAA